MIPLRFNRRFLVPALFLLLACASRISAQTAPTFSQVVVFGDSLSDDGNLRHRIEDNYPFQLSGRRL